MFEESEFYLRDTRGIVKTFDYNPQDMIHWIIRNCRVELK